MAVTDFAPYFFIHDIASNNYMIPSLILLFSNDFNIKIFWSRTGYNNWIFISPSLNRLLILRPNVISKCDVTSFAKIYASNANTLKLNDCNGYDVKNILFIDVFIYEIYD